MAEQFSLIERIGRGGMGTVWKARDNRSGEVVALKILNEAYAGDPEFVKRFEREANVARKVDSPYVVRVLGRGRQGGVPFLVMEFAEGMTLRQVLRERSTLPWEQDFARFSVRKLLQDVARALDAIHAVGIVHRDISPSNIILGPDGTARLLDFGIARVADFTPLTVEGTMMGNPAYMAPDSTYSPQSDLYAVGAVAYEALTGQPPFEGESLHEVLAQHLNRAPDIYRLPPEGRPVIKALLEKQVTQRTRSASELARSLGVSTPVRPSRGGKAARAVLPWVAAATALGAAGYSVIALSQVGSEAEPNAQPDRAGFVVPTPVPNELIEDGLIDALNSRRVLAGRPGLVRSVELDAIARMETLLVVSAEVDRDDCSFHQETTEWVARGLVCYLGPSGPAEALISSLTNAEDPDNQFLRGDFSHVGISRVALGSAYLVRFELGRSQIRQEAAGLPLVKEGTQLRVTLAQASRDNSTLSIRVTFENLSRGTVTLYLSEPDVASVDDGSSGPVQAAQWAEGGALLMAPVPYRTLQVYPFSSAVDATLEFTLPDLFASEFVLTIAGLRFETSMVEAAR